MVIHDCNAEKYGPYPCELLCRTLGRPPLQVIKGLVDGKEGIAGTHSMTKVKNVA